MVTVNLLLISELSRPNMTPLFVLSTLTMILLLLKSSSTMDILPVWNLMTLKINQVCFLADFSLFPFGLFLRTVFSFNLKVTVVWNITLPISRKDPLYFAHDMLQFKMTLILACTYLTKPGFGCALCILLGCDSISSTVVSWRLPKKAYLKEQ